MQVLRQSNGQYALLSWSKADDEPNTLELFSAPVPNLSGSAAFTAMQAVLTGMPGTIQVVQINAKSV
jgi:hypothetical protein